MESPMAAACFCWPPEEENVVRRRCCCFCLHNVRLFICVRVEAIRLQKLVRTSLARVVVGAPLPLILRALICANSKRKHPMHCLKRRLPRHRRPRFFHRVMCAAAAFAVVVATTGFAERFPFALGQNFPMCLRHSVRLSLSRSVCATTKTRLR